MVESFGTGVYVSDEQRWHLAKALLDKGYAVSTREHGGWGGGTEWVVTRWKTPHHVIVGRVVPALLLISSLFSGSASGFVMAMAPSLILFLVYGFPVFSASFMWWDSPSETEWDASCRGSAAEYAQVVAVVEDASGCKVKRR